MKGNVLPSVFLGDTHATREWSGCCGSHACSQQRKSEMIITPFWCIGKGHELTNSVIHDPCVRGEWQMIDNIFPHCFWQVACGRRDQSQVLKCIEISAQGKKAAANTWIMLHSAWDHLSSSYASLWAFYAVNALFSKAFSILCFSLMLLCVQDIEYHTGMDLQKTMHFLAGIFNNSQDQALSMRTIRQEIFQSLYHTIVNAKSLWFPCSNSVSISQPYKMPG